MTLKARGIMFFNRGVAHARIFSDETDYRVFMLEARDSLHANGVELHSYCLLPNHYHLLVHTPTAGLSTAMQQLGSRFTQTVNKHTQRDGPLLRGRFKSVCIADDAQMVATARYIHLNPVESGLVDRAEDWEWSSAHAYALGEAIPDWLKIEPLSKMASSADLIR